jgi:hypothetical protein
MAKPLWPNVSSIQYRNDRSLMRPTDSENTRDR